MPVLYITVGLSSGVAIKSGSTVGFKTAFNLCTVEADLLHIIIVISKIKYNRQI